MKKVSDFKKNINRVSNTPPIHKLLFLMPNQI